MDSAPRTTAPSHLCVMDNCRGLEEGIHGMSMSRRVRLGVLHDDPTIFMANSDLDERTI